MTDLQLLTIRDVMNITKLGRTKVYELLRDGELPCIRLGRSVRIRQDDLEAWLDRHRDPTPDDQMVSWLKRSR